MKNRLSFVICHLSFAICLWPFCLPASRAGEPAAAAPPVKEEELQRKERALAQSFPWLLSTPAQKAAPKAAKPADADSSLPDVTAGDILMRAAGGLFRVAPKATLKPDSVSENEKAIRDLLKSLDQHFSQINSALAADAGGQAARSGAGKAVEAPGNYPNVPIALVELVKEHRRMCEAPRGVGAPPAGGPRLSENLELEVLTFTKDVEIEQAQGQMVLRGQKITVVRDLKMGLTELLEATGSVELATPERKGKGERLVYRTQYGPDGQVLKDEYTIRGDEANGAKATLWEGDDIIEAMEVFSDRRLDTFRVRGQPVANVKMPEPPGAQPQGANPKAPAAPPKTQASAGGLLPDFGSMTSGKIRIRAEREMSYEGAIGRVRVTPNVVIQKDAPNGSVFMIMNSDEALLTFLPAPAGEPEAQSGVFAGSLKTLECLGRVEIKTETQTVLCDRGVLDMQNNTFLMEMKNPKDEVQIYMLEGQDVGKVLLVPRSLKYFLDTKELQAGGAQHMKRFTGTPPTNRGPAAEKPTAPKPKGTIP